MRWDLQRVVPVMLHAKGVPAAGGCGAVGGAKHLSVSAAQHAARFFAPRAAHAPLRMTNLNPFQYPPRKSCHTKTNARRGRSPAMIGAFDVLPGEITRATLLSAIRLAAGPPDL